MIRFDPYYDNEMELAQMESATSGEYVLYVDHEREMLIKILEIEMWRDAFRKLAGEL
jgi:hypothetical protein